MPAFDVDGALRWARLDPRRTLTRRTDEELPFANPGDLAGPPVLLDTGVYIHQLQGRAPTIIEQLVDVRHINHSSVAIQELTHTLGVLDPGDPRTAAVVSGIRAIFGAMPDHRIFAPDIDTLGRAALLAGTLAPTSQRYWPERAGDGRPRTAGGQALPTSRERHRRR